MNRFLVAIFAFVLLMFSCKGGKTGSSDAVPADSDSIQDTTAVDTMEQIIAETPMPKAADELFDDFFFNFAANKKLQKKRIKFPLTVVEGNKTTKMEKREWKTDYFFMSQGYYTLILNKMSDMNLSKDTSINNVVVEKIYLHKNIVKQYVFGRERGLWMLTAIETKSVSDNRNASFLQFYQKFATDSTFQANSLSDMVEFSGPDPDDDFSRMDGLITPDTWPAFAPELPSNMIYNIIYGERRGDSSRKIFVLRGIANGLEIEMSFKRKDGNWLLTKLNTY